MGSVRKDISEQINAFIQDATAVAHILSHRHHLPIECAHVENALTEVMGLETSTELLDTHWTQKRILSALANYDFRRFFPILLAQVRFDNSIIPPGSIRSLVEETVRCNGEVWRIHRNDADPFPSNPHGHNLQSGCKLHLGTGELFLRRHFVGKISRKDLVAIRHRLVGFDLPLLAR